MRRVFWVAVGAAAGVVAVRRASAALHRVTPAGVSESLQRAGARGQLSAEGFLDAVQRHAAAREAELRAALGLDAAPAAPGAAPGRRGR